MSDANEEMDIDMMDAPIDRKPLTARAILEQIAASMEHPAPIYLDYELSDDVAEDFRTLVHLSIGRAVGLTALVKP